MLGKENNLIKGKIMEVVKPVSNESWLILEQIFPGRADFLMQKTADDRMEALATYLAQQIKVKTWSSFVIGFLKKILKICWTLLNDNLYDKNQTFKNNESRLSSALHSMRPDCSTIKLAETSTQPEDWLLHPTGISFKFDVQKVEAKVKLFLMQFSMISSSHSFSNFSYLYLNVQARLSSLAVRCNHFLLYSWYSFIL